MFFSRQHLEGILMSNSTEIDDYDLLEKYPDECRRRGMEAYGITEDQLSVVTPYEIHSILIVNM